ncbi:MAG TPA: NAD(P)H-binding protein [Gammaproteobacteria bacterium]
MNRQKPMVLILGANGRLGRALVEAFAVAGWRVRAQLRDQSRWQQAGSASIAPWYCDAHDRAALCRAAEGCEVVVNALNPLYTQWEQNALPLAENALAAARASGVLLLFPGNIYNFGNQLPEQLHEDTPQVGNTTKAQIRIAMEERLRAAADEVDSVVLRTGDYLGGTGSWFDRVIAKELRKGKITYPGPTDRLHAWAYLPDFAEAFVRVAARRSELRGFHTYHFPGYAITGAELHRTLEEVTARQLRLGKMPWWSLRLAAPFSPMARAILDMRYLWERPHRVEDGALTALIGTLPTTPLHDALQATLSGLGVLTMKEDWHHA